jgi:hypothetical protein
LALLLADVIASRNVTKPSTAMVSPVPVTVMVAARVVACTTASAINNAHPNRLVFLPATSTKLTNDISTFHFANRFCGSRSTWRELPDALLKALNELDANASVSESAIVVN